MQGLSMYLYMGWVIMKACFAGRHVAEVLGGHEQVLSTPLVPIPHPDAASTPPGGLHSQVKGVARAYESVKVCVCRGKEGGVCLCVSARMCEAYNSACVRLHIPVCCAASFCWHCTIAC